MTTPLFNFETEFRLGIPEIDDEHVRLVTMLNEVHELIRTNEKEKAGQYFKETLSGYVETHFSHEEDFMEKIGFPQMEEHKKVHINYKRSMVDTLHGIDSLDDGAFRNALSDTFTWIINHIGKTDRKYANFLQSK